MSANLPTVPAADISWDSSDRVIIRNADFVRSLVENGKAEALKPIAAEGTLSPSVVTIDAHGDVVITDAAFRTMVQERLKSNPGGLTETVDGLPLNLSTVCLQIGNIVCHMVPTTQPQH